MRRFPHLLIGILLLMAQNPVLGQSLELMPGLERFFGDVQWLKPLSEDYRWTVFSRTRVTVDYEGNTDLFSGAYFNYTTPSGFGGTILGRISSNDSGSDIGIHYTKSSDRLTIFALPFINLNDELLYGWFSIVRYKPPLGESLSLYTSLELFSTLTDLGHNFSVQRMRLGLQQGKYQWGLALNVSEVGRDFDSQVNLGVFVRREF